MLNINTFGKKMKEEFEKSQDTDKPKALKRGCIYNIDICSRKKGFQAFIYIY